MKSNVLEYKGYHTNVEFDSEAFKLRGKIEGINDLVNFEADTLQSVEEEFHLAVDDYLDFCAEVGKNPDKEYKGTFNVRIDPELHKELAILASKNDESLNTAVEKAIRAYIASESITNSQLKQSIDSLSDALKSNQSTYIATSTPKVNGDNIIAYKNPIDVKLKFEERKYK